MATTETVQGVLNPDGTLELHDRPTLPAGPVRVTLEVERQSQEAPWAALQQIWDERKARGMQPRSAEEIDAQMREMREEWDQRQNELEQIQQAARRSRAE